VAISCTVFNVCGLTVMVLVLDLMIATATLHGLGVVSRPAHGPVTTVNYCKSPPPESLKERSKFGFRVRDRVSLWVTLKPGI